MVITREALTKRIEELEGEIEVARQRHTMLSGALADAKYWLEQLEKEDPQA